MEKIPIPKHLQNVLIPIGENDEYSVKGHIKCQCGNDNRFKILFAGEKIEYEGKNKLTMIEYKEEYYLVIKVICLKCNKEILIFDDNLHGWDGFVCHDKNKPEFPEEKFEIWKCNNCKSESHNLIVKISSLGKQDFIDEAGNEYNPDDWVESFDWITIGIKCNNCDCEDEEWLSHETM